MPVDCPFVSGGSEGVDAFSGGTNTGINRPNRRGEKIKKDKYPKLCTEYVRWKLEEAAWWLRPRISGSIYSMARMEKG